MGDGRGGGAGRGSWRAGVQRRWTEGKGGGAQTVGNGLVSKPAELVVGLVTASQHR